MTKIVDRINQTDVSLQSNFGIELNTIVEKQLQNDTIPIVKRVIERLIEEEFSGHIAESKSKGIPSKELYRSGTFKRELTTSYGHISDLSVPKLRKDNKKREWKILSRHKKMMPMLIGKLMYLYVLGLSIRDLQESLYVLNGKMLDKNTINGITIELQHRLSELRAQPISGDFIALIVDGVWVNICYPTGKTKIDKAGHQRKEIKVETRVILACIGVSTDKSYKLIHYQVYETESEETWNSFFSEIKEKGLDEHTIEIISSDGSKGILRSINKNFTNAKLQRCINHKADNISLYLTYKDLEDVLGVIKAEEKEVEDQIQSTKTAKVGKIDIQSKEQNITDTKEKQKQKYRNTIIGHAKNIFLADDITEAKRRLEQWIQKWKDIEPKAVSVFTKGINRCFEFYNLDISFHKLIRTTNLIERSFREFRTKSGEIGAFPNEVSCCTVFQITINRFHSKNQT